MIWINKFNSILNKESYEGDIFIVGNVLCSIDDVDDDWIIYIYFYLNIFLSTLPILLNIIFLAQN